LFPVWATKLPRALMELFDFYSPDDSSPLAMCFELVPFSDSKVSFLSSARSLLPPRSRMKTVFPRFDEHGSALVFSVGKTLLAPTQ